MQLSRVQCTLANSAGCAPEIAERVYNSGDGMAPCYVVVNEEAPLIRVSLGVMFVFVHARLCATLGTVLCSITGLHTRNIFIEIDAIHEQASPFEVYDP